MTSGVILCPICDVGSLKAARYSGLFSHNGRKILVEGLEKYECSECDGDPILTDQVRRNQIKIADARRRTDGLLASGEIRRIRERLGLSQSAAANVFGGGENAFSKYERGEVVQSYQMDRLLRLALDLPASLALLAHYDGETIANRRLISNAASGEATWQHGSAFIHQPLTPQLSRKTG